VVAVLASLGLGYILAGFATELWHYLVTVGLLGGQTGRVQARVGNLISNPLTLTVQSPEATRRWPLRRLAACTMMLPRARWMVVSFPRAVTDSSARSPISTTEPSRRRSVEPR